MKKPLLCVYPILGIFQAILPGLLAGEIDFNRDIRPILSDKCFHCHGPDAKNQKSDFRLDTREHAVEDLGGYFGIVPGDLEESEAHWRIRAGNDEDDVMPPLDSNRILSNREKDLLDQWIKEGANYDIHWSFKRPERPPVPKLDGDAAARARNPIDHFVAARLKAEGLAFSPEAGLELLLRRASLTLTGLPPSPEVLDAALAAGPEKAYEKFVGQLLSSTDYAERQTLRWLDAARYADTDGYQNDNERKNWPWRDWVIQAFHENMPFDQFTIEQLAGDMLPNATPKQVLASAFNRNHRQNSEGGALADEFFIENVIDRVETTSTVWLGLTMGCARCHDHKYDPLSQREFFQLFAYFNNIGERGIGKGVAANPTLEIGSPLIEVPEELAARKEAAKKAEAEAAKGLGERRKAWIAEMTAALGGGQTDDWTLQEIDAPAVDGDGTLTRETDGSLLFSGQNIGKVTYKLRVPGEGRKITGIRLDALPNSDFGKPRQLARSVNGNFVLSGFEVVVSDGKKPERPVRIAGVTATFEQDRYPVSNTLDGKPGTGWAVFGKDVKPETVSAFFVLDEPVELAKGGFLEIRLSHESTFADHNIGRLKIHLTGQPDLKLETGAGLNAKVLAALKTPADRRSAAEQKVLTDHHRGIDDPTRKARKLREETDREMQKLGIASVPVMVMREREGEPVPAYRLDRGQYDAPDKSEALPRGVPAALFAGDPKEQPKDRLEMVRWLVSPANPLTARVAVNRIWLDHFGTGLVKTGEDFGSQGELPSHPKLLDWLAVEFIESGWDVKALHRLIVTSATFRQSSAVTEALLEHDPANRLLARGPRYRMDGFSIRDNALRAAGLLDNRVGGPPVKPYQPEGLWNAVSAGAGVRYSPAKGADLYRKSLYTYWKRAVNPPRQLIFDAAGREACNVLARRTNTPLQALVLMNDVTFVEAARNVAARTLEQGKDEQEGLARMYRTITAESADEKTVAVLGGNLGYFREHFSKHPEEAAAFLAAGESPQNEQVPVPEQAAWTAVAHLLLNLDKTITIE